MGLDETTFKITSPKYDPAYDRFLSQENKKKGKKEKEDGAKLVSPMAKINLSTKSNEGTKTTVLSPETKKAKKGKKNGPELLSPKMNLSTEVNVDKKTEVPSPKYEPAYERYVSQQIKKNTKKEKKNSPEVISRLPEMNVLNEVKVDTNAYERYVSQHI